ncbi:MAG: MotA/TolQ/ExbB proton channel family protein [Acutalibacteraceae bacterium]|jgi:amino acid transporter
MELYSYAFNLLFKSLTTNDIYIFVTALITSFLFLLTILNARHIKVRTKEWKKDKNPPFSKFLLRSLNLVYTLFTTLISIFPLLGMFGTVLGLLGLDLTKGDMENIRNNFFIALTSTAWGIIFSVIFKVANAFISDFVEEQIEAAKKLADDMESKQK